jgi:hypothetical protein
MKKLLLLLLISVAATAQTVTTICPTLASGMSQYPDPSTQVSYSVSNSELTLTFTNYNFWGDEVKINFASTLDLSSQSLTDVISYTVSVSNITIGNCNDAGNNYVGLGISLYDTDGDYSNGTASSIGFWGTDQAGTNSVANAPAAFNSASIQGMAIKASSSNYANCSGTATLASGVVVIKNLKIGSGNCTASLLGGTNATASLQLFPNPATEEVTLNLSLPETSSVMVEVRDVLGKSVLKMEEVNTAELSKTFNVSSLSEGVYQVSYYVNGVVSGTEMLVVK